MLETISQLANLVLAIFVIVDPFAVVPVYLSITEHLPSTQREKTAFKASLIALGILVFFAVCGLWLFDIFGITLPAFQIAGGILLLRLGLAQLSADRSRMKPEEAAESMAKEDVSVFPLATPLLAGPGAISTVVLISAENPGIQNTALVIVAIVVALSLSFLLLYFAKNLLRVLGKTGLNIMTRIMGIILTALSIQYIINGVSQIVKEFP